MSELPNIHEQKHVSCNEKEGKTEIFWNILNLDCVCLKTIKAVQYS